MKNTHKRKHRKINLRYLPKNLSFTDKKKQSQRLLKSKEIV